MAPLSSPLSSRRTGPLAGRIRIPGDKSISHRSLMLGAVALGETVVDGLLEGEDVLATAEALRALGARIERRVDGTWSIEGVGSGGLVEPSSVLDLGNSGTAIRLLAGLVASHRMTAFFTGDASLVSRPMGRIIEPLARIGARFVTRGGHRLPMAILGTDEGLPITYRLPVASAQVKSAMLLAGLNVAGRTTVVEAAPTRDHTETMLGAFGAEVLREETEDGMAISLTGYPELRGTRLTVPGDASSAGFPLVAALIVPESEVLLENVGLNPTRSGLLETLLEMGADITVSDERSEGGERVGTLTARAGRLKGVTVPAERAPRMIDEYPVLAMAAACAEGKTRMEGIGELRVKESDRLALVAQGLAACGAKVEAGEDWLEVTGSGKPPEGGALVETALDHRIAMSFLVLGMATAAPVTVSDAAPIATSFPTFREAMSGLGATFLDTDAEAA